MKIKKLLSMGMVVVFAGALIAGCGGSSGSTDTAPASDGTEGDAEVLVMATEATFPPYEYAADDGSYEGIDIEIANKVAEKMGRTLDVQNVDFDSIIAGVQAGKYDMGMAGMTVTDERKQSVNFSDPYAKAVQVIIVPNGSKIKSADDLSAKTKIGVQEGTTGQIYAEDDYGADAVTSYKKTNEAISDLSAGRLDCVILDNEPAKSYVKSTDGLKILDSEYVEEEYAICISKDNEDLLKDVNGALKELKDDGTIDGIIEKYIPAE